MKKLYKNVTNRFLIEKINSLSSHHNKLNKIKKKHLIWPSTTSHGQLRTINSIDYISNAIANGRNSDEESEELTKEEKLGIVGTSLLLTQPRFNMIKSIPVEYLSLIHI